VLSLQWRQVDFSVGEVRLDPRITKNREGRVFYLRPELHGFLKEQRAVARERSWLSERVLIELRNRRASILVSVDAVTIFDRREVPPPDPSLRTFHIILLQFTKDNAGRS
jgi:integrase